MPRDKAPKTRLKKKEKDQLKVAKDGGKTFIQTFTLALDATLPEVKK